MIIEENIGNNLVKHYSDSGVKIRQMETDIVYVDATDIKPCRFTYEETDIPIDDDTTAEELLNILTGENE